MAPKSLKDLDIVVDELYHRGSGGVLTRASHWLKQKKNYMKFKIFHVESMISTCIGVCRCMDFIWLKWLEMLLKFKGPIRNVRNIYRGIYSFKKQKIGGKGI